jgi:hypothetical protein
MKESLPWETVSLHRVLQKQRVVTSSNNASDDNVYLFTLATNLQNASNKQFKKIKCAKYWYLLIYKGKSFHKNLFKVKYHKLKLIFPLLYK